MKKKVLIVEDDVDMQEYFKIILSGPRFDLLHAANGQEALSLIDAGEQIDVILLDMVMPVMDGEEFFRILRIDRKLEIPVIYCSVDETRADPLRSIGEIQGIFVKGNHSDELKELIEKNV